MFKSPLKDPQTLIDHLKQHGYVVSIDQILIGTLIASPNVQYVLTFTPHRLVLMPIGMLSRDFTGDDAIIPKSNLEKITLKQAWLTHYLILTINHKTITFQVDFKRPEFQARNVPQIKNLIHHYIPKEVC